LVQATAEKKFGGRTSLPKDGIRVYIGLMENAPPHNWRLIKKNKKNLKKRRVSVEVDMEMGKKGSVKKSRLTVKREKEETLFSPTF
jgi:hypothetical protein